MILPDDDLSPAIKETFTQRTYREFAEGLARAKEAGKKLAGRPPVIKESEPVPMMPEDLAAELDRLDKAATRSPWDIRLNGPEDETQWCDLTHLDPRWPQHPQVHGSDLSVQDAELIAWLRNHTDEIKAALKGSVYLRGHDRLTVERDKARADVAEWIQKWEVAHDRALAAETDRDRQRDRADGLAEDRARLRATVDRACEVIDDITITDPGLVVVRVGKILDELKGGS